MAKRINEKSYNHPKGPQRRVILASLKLALERNWNEVSLGEIAKSANMQLIEVYKLFHSKNAILKALNQQMDTDVMANAATVSSKGTIRDQIFELLMLRFDALTREKEAITRIIRCNISRDPIASFIGLKASKVSMGIIMEAAGISTKTPIGQLQVNGLLAIYLNTICTWLKDDTPDLSKTMADLDKSLARAEAFLYSLPFKNFKIDNSKLNKNSRNKV